MKKSRLKIVINSPVILTFVLISFIATLLNELTGGTSTAMFFMTYHSPLTNPLTWLRFFTHVFGHSGWDHLIGNMTYLLLLGPMLEEKYGSADILEVIAVTALVTGLVNYIFFPNVATCGA
ncbi:MAG: rhomboid family intramembrane serine protease, partial [Lachnospiraceae bacterium]|nr:rhomboid family intramembrane serine protease [Lachnospiraceae bacterium]